ncbi:hypothetical protein BT96DRAFT_1001933 [Gymnopus androsaceus JB14]|uniref:Uncharacterized protein n=1 Tax=Gymnopus androsaceus JB14 TaxID=1447944 RepID=A0A6A4GYG0_9AGAR|nr:hypothetical protein BT96DRAFT_1001933 [Gymnopus androsaceus JB14]
MPANDSKKDIKKKLPVTQKPKFDLTVLYPKDNEISKTSIIKKLKERKIYADKDHQAMLEILGDPLRSIFTGKVTARFYDLHLFESILQDFSIAREPATAMPQTPKKAKQLPTPAKTPRKRKRLRSPSLDISDPIPSVGTSFNCSTGRNVRHRHLSHDEVAFIERSASPSSHRGTKEDPIILI